MTMDRESKPVAFEFPAGSESPPISGARYAWCSLHLPANFATATITFEVKNEETGNYVAVLDTTGVAVPTAAGAAGVVIPVPLEVNHARIWRFTTSAAQPATTFKVVNKT